MPELDGIQPTISGVIVLDKPAGPTSHDMVLRLRRIFRKHRIGHIGTLDPFATGVLPLCIGRATRLAQYLGKGDKVYECTVCFGMATDTGDLTGKPIGAPVTASLDPRVLELHLSAFRGEILQKPPIYSARKVRGVPLYRYAREGTPVQTEPRKVTVYELKLLGIEGTRCRLGLRCSPGTYIRAIAMELGESLGCGAYLESLRRTLAGEFSLERAVSVAHLDSDRGETEILERLIPMEDLLPDYPRIELSDEDFRRAANGSPVAAGVNEHLLKNAARDSTPYVRLFSKEGRLVALGRPEPASASIPLTSQPQDLESVWIRPVTVVL